MQILHIHWQPPQDPSESGGIYLWAENGDALQPEKVRSKKKVLEHPFCSTPDMLVELNPLLIESGRVKRLILLLPSTKTGPLPSPQVIHDWELDTESPWLRQWYIKTVWLPPREAFTLLRQLPMDTPQLLLGDDCRYWETASDLVLEVVAQQKLLPTLAQVAAGTFHARWMPVLDGPQDGPRLAQLTTSMPPLCRVETNDPLQAPTATRLLESFLNVMSDSLGREWGTIQKRLNTSQDPAHSWMEALFVSDNPLVLGTAAQLNHLHQSYSNWVRNLHIAGDKTFRVAFRLEAPVQQVDENGEVAETKPLWKLHFLLQAREDPSLLVTAEQVWAAQGKGLMALNRQFKNPQERLLVGLGYAARLFKPLEAGLREFRPTNIELTTEQAYEFLRETAPLLEASGFGVLVPPWWNKPGTRLGVRLKMQGSKQVETSSTGHMKFDNLVNYRWELSVGDTELTQVEFKALAALKSPLVEIRGQWVQLDSEQVEKAINFWEKHSLEDEISLHEALGLGLGAEDEIAGLPIEGVEVEGWLKEWMDQLQGEESLSLLPQPEGLQGTLRPYQQYGYSWLYFLRRWGMGACLADDMGLGKTIQTLALLLHDKEAGELPGPTLLVCPTSVVTNWEREVKQFTPPLSTMVHQGPDRLRDEAFIEAAQATDMVLTSYALVRRDVEMMRQIEWYGVILDEAQNIKNPSTKQSRAVRQMSCQFRIALTGTPIENRLSELWSIMQFLNPGYLGSQKYFRKNFAIPIENYHDAEVTARLRRLVDPFILRRVKTDPTVIQDLPEKMEMKVYCRLSQEQATLYEAVVQEAMEAVAESGGMKRRGIVLSMLMKLKQICNHPGHFLHQLDGSKGQHLNPEQAAVRSGKLSRLTEILEELLSANDRALIFTQFSEMGHFLKQYVQQTFGVQTLFLYGGTPAEKRTTLINQFQDEVHGPPVFILSLKAGGTGLNLTEANHVFHFDRWWNPAVEDQATDRAFRIGQQRNVQVHKFVCVGTLEERIDEMLESKKDLAEKVVGGEDGWMTELSTDDLRDLVGLRQEALE